MGIGPKSSLYSVDLHSGGVQRGPGPADGHQEEGRDQQHHHHHDFHDARATKLEPICAQWKLDESPIKSVQVRKLIGFLL